MVHALVITKIDCNALYFALEISMEISAAPKCGSQTDYRYQQTFPILAHLHWFPFSFCAQFKVLFINNKALNGSECQRLAEPLSHEIASHPIHFSQSLMLRILHPSREKKVSTRNQAFSVMSSGTSFLQRFTRHYPSEFLGSYLRLNYKAAFFYCEYCPKIDFNLCIFV